MIDDGHAIHYSAVERGTPIYTADGVEIGKVDAVLDNYNEHILDGIVLETPEGDLRFIDGPEVQRTAERGVTLNIAADAASRLPAPEKAPPRFSPRRGGRLSRMFGGGWKKH